MVVANRERVVKLVTGQFLRSLRQSIQEISGSPGPGPSTVTRDQQKVNVLVTKEDDGCTDATNL